MGLLETARGWFSPTVQAVGKAPRGLPGSPREVRMRRERMTGGPLGWGGGEVTNLRSAVDDEVEVAGAQGLRTAARMRADGQVRAVLSVIGLPIRSTNWYVEPPAQPSASEKEAAELLQTDLMGGMKCSFDDVLRDTLRAVYFGFNLSELEWEERAGRAALRSIESRNPLLIESWLYDEQGDLAGALYAGTKLRGSGAVDRPAAHTYARVVLPIYRLVHTIYEGENGNPTGQGLWRPMYTHWKIKDFFYQTSMTVAERTAMGVPYATMPETASPEDRQKMVDCLRWLRSTRDSAIVLPFGTTIDWFEVRRDITEALPIMQHHDALMARAALAQFLNLGQTQTGTQSLATEHVRLFMDAEDGIARGMASSLTRQVARRWYEMNYPRADARRCPRLRHRPIRMQNLDGLSSALSALVQGKLLTPGTEDEEHVRALAELPTVPREQLESRRSLDKVSAR
jgi:phage gp29-like protein